MRKLLIVTLISILILTPIVWILILVPYYYLSNLISGNTITKFSLKAIISFNVKVSCISFFVILFLIIFVFAYFSFSYKKQTKKYLKQSSQDDYGNARLLVDERKKQYLNKKDFFKIYEKNNKNPHWLIKYEKNKSDKLDFFGVNVKTCPHAILIGESGSGKGEKILKPCIVSNARIENIKNKPNMIIVDPKGEIKKQLAGELQENNYEILTLNLKNPSDSNIWNPLCCIYKYWTKSMDFEKDNIISNSFDIDTNNFCDEYNNFDIDKLLNNEKFINWLKQNTDNKKCYEHKLVSCCKCLKKFTDNLVNKEDKFAIHILNETLKFNFYFYNDEWFNCENSKNKFINFNKEQLQQFVYNDIDDLVFTLISSENRGQNENFFTTAQGYLKGILLLFLEIMEYDRNLIPLKKFNFTTITKIIADEIKTIDWLNKYNKLKGTSDAWVSLSKVVTQSDKNLSLYTGIVKDGLRIFENIALRKILTSQEENFNKELDLLNIFNFERPLALFLIIPDDRKDKNALATLFITQVYKSLVFKAQQNLEKFGKEKLERATLFILDEFGNLPTIPHFDSIITVSRSRDIHFLMALQNLGQLKAKYHSYASTIKDNSSLLIYLKSFSLETHEEICKIAGKKTIEQASLEENSTKSKNVVRHLTSIDLIPTTNIANLDNNYSIILNSKSFPSIVKANYAYKMISKKTNESLLGENKVFNESNFYFNYESSKHIFSLNEYIDFDNKVSNVKTSESININNEDYIDSEKDIKLQKQKIIDRLLVLGNKKFFKLTTEEKNEFFELKKQLQELRKKTWN